MSIQTFGVTEETVRAHFFPHLDAFSGASSPTAATMLEMISASAATLAGKLRAEGASPSDIAQDPSSEAYAWIAETIRLGAAIRAIRMMTGQDMDVAKAWAAELDARIKALDEGGVQALGDVVLPSASSNGPVTHIGRMSLNAGDSSETSDVVPRFRRSDKL